MTVEHTKKANILGTEYTIYYQSENPRFEHCDGYTDFSTKEIFVMIQKPNQDWWQDIRYYEKYVLRHEIIHAFLFESGLDSQSNEAEEWAKNEEMIDWLAIQFDKIEKVYKQLKI